MSNERWTQERYEAELDKAAPSWRAKRKPMPCTCDYEECHGWAAIRFGNEAEHLEDEEDRRQEPGLPQYSPSAGNE